MLTMLFYIDGGDRRESKPEKAKTEKPVSGVAALLACIITIGGSGFISLQLTDPDRGKTVTLAEMRVRMLREAERISNDPHMPPKAKAIALRALRNGTWAVPYARKD